MLHDLPSSYDDSLGASLIAHISFVAAHIIAKEAVGIDEIAKNLS